MTESSTAFMHRPADPIVPRRRAHAGAAPGAHAPLAASLPDSLGAPPVGDGWGWCYRLYACRVRPVPALRAAVHWYFRPRRLELWRDGRLYRLLGVPVFGRIVPTGGILVRRLTGARMRGYSLASRSLSAARAYAHRTCAIEAAHLVVFAALAAAAGRCLVLGRPWLAVAGIAADLAVNAYPVLLQRHTRLRILALLARRPDSFPTPRDTRVAQAPQ